MQSNIDDRLRGHSNALNLVRLCLASTVILSHKAPIAGVAGFPLWGEKPIGEWAVAGFFGISGYLITGSRTRLPFFAYLWRRALRILPAFWVALIVVAFGFAPLSTLVSSSHWSLWSSVDYVRSNFFLLIRAWGVDGTLTSVPFGGVWNGSLWTLSFEFLAYIAAGVLLAAIPLRHPLVLGGVSLAAMLGYQLAAGPLDVSTMFYKNALWLGSFFAAGMFMWAARESVPSDWRLAVVATGVLAASAMGSFFLWVGPFPLVYLLLYLGGRLPWHLGSTNDISYGVYIYAFPVQQSLVLLGGAALGFWGFSIVSLGLTLPLALASWFLVERPMMRLKALVGRGSAPNPRPSGSATRSSLADGHSS